MDFNLAVKMINIHYFCYVMCNLVLLTISEGRGSVVTFEAEDMDTVRNSMVHYRSQASGTKAVLLTSGQALSVDLCLMTDANISVASLTYSNDGEADLIEVAVDSNVSVWNFNTKMVKGDGSGWNNFITLHSDMAPILIPEGRHRLTIQALVSDNFGVEIDNIKIKSDLNNNVDTLKCSVFCFDDITYTDDAPLQDHSNSLARAEQMSVPTRCAEEDNVNIPVFHDTASKYIVSASMPKYQTFQNRRGPDWLNCAMSEAFWLFKDLYISNGILNSQTRASSAVIHYTDSDGFLLNENTHSLSVEFTLKGPSIGLTDSEIGAIVYLNGTRSTENIRIEFQYLDRYNTWSKIITKFYNGTLSDFQFEVPDFSFKESEKNRISIKLFTHSNADIYFASLYMEKRKLKDDMSRTIFNDGSTVIEAVDVDMWWRINETMSVSLGLGSKSFNNVDYLRVYQQVPWSSASFSQVFVLYQDGNVRLLPLTPHGLDWIPFGSSVIIGQSDSSSERPCAPIAHLDIDPQTLSIKIFYMDGAHTHMQLKTTLHETQLIVHESSYTRQLTHYPFFTFRSMWLNDGNADVDHVTVDGNNTHRILGSWGNLYGNFFAFYRKCISKHNTLSPDIRLKILS